MVKRVAQNILVYNILISCPGDIIEERKIIDEAITRFNTLFSDTLSIALRSKDWTKNSFPESGDKPQALLNKQLVNDCDAAVAIMWGRFGTPTDKYGSGTEEEIELMLSQGKQVFMYFSDAPISPSKIVNDQYKRVTDFREKYKDRGIYSVFASAEEFRKIFFAHLSEYFLIQKRVAEIKEKERPQLRLVGIDDNNRLSEKGIITRFGSRMLRTSQQMDNEITNRIMAVNNIHLQTINPSDTFLMLREKVTFKNTTTRRIRQYAEEKNIELSEEFFNCGSLSRDSFSVNLDGSRQYYGSKEEREKHNEIIRICDLIDLRNAILEIEKNYSDIRCIKLAVTNCGKSYDEDIEISISVPKGMILLHQDLPQLSDETISTIMRDITVDTLFGIHETAEIDSYNNNRRDFAVPPVEFINHDETEQFEKQMDYQFAYSVFTETNKTMLKVNIPYLKHNSSIAFPTPIFIKEMLGEIEYRITSKHSPEIVKGTIKMEVAFSI